MPCPLLACKASFLWERGSPLCAGTWAPGGTQRESVCHSSPHHGLVGVSQLLGRTPSWCLTWRLRFSRNLQDPSPSPKSGLAWPGL